MNEDHREELKELITYPSSLSDFEGWLYSFTIDHPKMTMTEFHEAFKKIMGK